MNEPKNLARIKSLVLKLFDIADTRIYYDGDADMLPEEAEEAMDELGMVLFEEFGLDINEIIKENGSSMEREFKLK